jgi:hypothetical protein
MSRRKRGAVARLPNLAARAAARVGPDALAARATAPPALRGVAQPVGVGLLPTRAAHAVPHLVEAGVRIDARDEDVLSSRAITREPERGRTDLMGYSDIDYKKDHP